MYNDLIFSFQKKDDENTKNINSTILILLSLTKIDEIKNLLIKGISPFY